jgi:hypothetical protein
MTDAPARSAAWTPPEDIAAVAPAWLRERRLALWGLLTAKLVAGWGVQWDIRWHVLVGRDSFWIPPHVMTYAGVTLAVLLSFGILARETWRTRAAGTAPPGAVRFRGLTGTPGFHLAAWGIAITVLAAPVDDLWHRVFGLDVTLWSPPHLLGIVGAAVSTFAGLRIAHEVYPPASHLRLVALLVTGALLYGTVHLVVEPSPRIAYVYGGVRFHTYAILSALLMPSVLLATARLTARRSAPVLVLLILLAVGLAGRQIEQAGFGWLQPVSVIETVIAREPTSPIAIAHEIARKNGAAPGRPAAALPLLLLVPGAVMAVVDARRRPVVASAGYAVALFAVIGSLLATRPAFRPLVPGPGTTALALALTVLAAVAGGVAGRWLAERLGPEPV